MGQTLNLCILIPLIPFGMSLFIFTLLRFFNKTINRLTKPVSLLIILSILISTSLSIYFVTRNIEGTIFLSTFSSFLKESEIKLHLNSLNEKIIIGVGFIAAFLASYSVLKLPRKIGFVLYMVLIGLATSLIETALLIFNF